MNNSNMKKLLGLALVAQGLYLTGRTIYTAVKFSELSKKDKKFTTPLPHEIKEQYLIEKVGEINRVLNMISPFFEPARLDEDSFIDMAKIPFCSFECESVYEKIKVKISDENTNEVKTAYYKIIFAPIKGTTNTSITLRLVMNEWDGYIDIPLYEAMAKASTNRTFLIVETINPRIPNPLLKDDVIYIERYAVKDQNTIVISNIQSGKKITSQKFKGK